MADCGRVQENAEVPHQARRRKRTAITVSTKKKQIAIVGLKNNQRRRIEQACHDVARLTFMDERRPPSDLPAADHTILMPKFIKKHWTKVALSTQDRDTVHLHWGGISKLVERIETLCA